RNSCFLFKPPDDVSPARRYFLQYFFHAFDLRITLIDQFLYPAYQVITFHQIRFKLVKMQLVIPVEVYSKIFSHTNRHFAAAEFLNQMKFQMKTARSSATGIDVLRFGNDRMRLQVHLRKSLLKLAGSFHMGCGG